ncbi:myomegalin isoform 3-T3 [Menidia menidia]
MLDAVRMKEACRICARELCGNQRRWIFHPGAKLNLQVLLSHALGQELTRDGRGEFACSKCSFMLERMYRFDTVVARVEALSLERLHKLLLEKERLRHCIGGLYRRNNPQSCGAAPPEATPLPEDPPVVVDLSALQDARYSDLIQDDLAYSVYESWAEKEDPPVEPLLHQCSGESGLRPRRCRGCAALRVADSDYEAVCKVPRRAGRRSTSCGPSTRYSTATLNVEDPARASEASAGPCQSPPAGMEEDKTLCDQRSPSPDSSVESLDTTVDAGCSPADHKGGEDAVPPAQEGRGPLLSEGSPGGLEVMLSLVRGWEYRPVRPHRGSRLPVLVKTKLEHGLCLHPSVSERSPCGGPPDYELYPHHTIPEVVVGGPQQELQAELAEMEEQWLDDYVQCGPFRFQQRLIDQQQGQLSEYEGAAAQCVAELQKAQQQVRSLQAKIRASESRNQKLQGHLAEMELELRSAREEAQQQERNVQNLSDTLNSREAETAEFCRVIEEQNKMLCSLKELANHSQMQQLQGSGAEALQSQVLALQASLFQAQLELEAGQRAQQHAARVQEDQNRALERLETALQGALQHRRETERHNQELQLALQEARSALQQREELLGEREQERQREKEEKERSIGELRASLQTKEQLLEDYFEMLEDPKEKTDSMLQKLRQRIKERDRALERAVDEKFRWVEEKEEDSHRLQLLLREKERDLERQRCVLAHNQETIASLELLVRGKTLELGQACDAWRSLQQQQQAGEERQARLLRDRENVTEQLQAALTARTQEAQDLRCSLLARVHCAPNDVLEELKVRLQLKDRLFQEVLADRTHQAREHQEQVQDLLRTIRSRDQYIKDSASQLSEVITEQAARLQELRTQMSSGFGARPDPGPDLSVELQAVQEELRLAFRREKESQELSRGQAARLDSLSRSLRVKEETVRELQSQLVGPLELPLVERLTQEVQELRERLVQQDAPAARGPNFRLPEFGELSSEEEADEDLNSEYTESVGEEESSVQRRGATAASQDLQLDGQSLMVVKQLVGQKEVVERELGELKGQLERAGFSSLSQMRKALFSLQAENKDLKHQLADRRQQEEEEEELEVTIEEEEEEEEEEEISELWDAWDGELAQTSGTKPQDEPPAGRPKDVPPSQRSEKTVHLQQESKELQERLMVSEATVQAQAEQLKDYRELLTETAVRQDSKQIQVDLQDMGYETCGRSENEAEREDASSPEFDDLEMCTSLDCGSQWWPAGARGGGRGPGGQGPGGQGPGDEASSLQRLVEDLRSQLSRSQGVIRGLQSRLRSLSTSSDCRPPTPRKVNWSFQASPSQSGTEEDEGWQSSDGGALASPRHPHPDRGLRELSSRVDALENQLRRGGKTSEEDGKSAAWPGKFDGLIQSQARELSHLRQRLREGRGVCSILTQHLGDTTKAFEELLRANDIDYYMGQGFREQLAQSGALAQRVSAKISGPGDHSEDPDEKTELLAIQLSKELQQKDKVIESLRAKLSQHQHHHHHPHHRSDTPSSSHALSDTTDQSDRISYVSDEHGSTNEDLELCSDVDGVSEAAQEEARTPTRGGTDCHSHHGVLSCHASAPSSVTSNQSCPSMQCSGSSCKPADALSHSAPTFSSAPCPSLPSRPQKAPFSLRAPTSNLRARHQRGGGAGFTLAEVQQELQMLQRQLGGGARFSTPQPKALHGLGLQPPADSSGFPPLSYQRFQPSPFTRAASSSSLDASLAAKAGSSLLESSALWDTAYGARPTRIGADVSSGSSGYQSGTSHTGSDLMKEHLKEIRTLRQRLEDSIQTNDRLRQQLEERLARTSAEKGAPTNIYIQGLDSVSQLSSEILLLKKENISLQQAAREGRKEAEQLREAAVLERSRLKEAGLDAARWAEQSRKLQAEAEARSHEMAQLKQDRQRNQETITRLQHEVSVLRQQLSESRTLVQTLQRDLQAYGNTGSVQISDHAQSATSDPKEPHVQLEQQQTGQGGAQPRVKRQLFSDKVPSPPVMDTGLLGHSSPLHPAKKHEAGAADQAGLALQGPASHQGRHAVGHIQDFEALRQQLLEGSSLLLKMEAALLSLSSSQEVRLHQLSDSGWFGKLLSDCRTLKQILLEADSLLWSAAPPDSEEVCQDQSLRDEVVSLRLKLSDQEQALRDTMERLKSSNLTKDSMEHFIISQLSRTRDVLKKAKTNLQENKLRMASLFQASLSAPPSSSSFSSYPRPVKGESTGSSHRPTFSPGRSVLMPRPLSSSSSSSSSALQQRPLPAACFL